jgi:hypothetical protein
MNTTKFMLRLLGNWGVSFFGPLVSGNVAETIYDIGLSFQETVIIALVSSFFVTGLVFFREVERIGQEKSK